MFFIYFILFIFIFKMDNKITGQILRFNYTSNQQVIFHRTDVIYLFSLWFIFEANLNHLIWSYTFALNPCGLDISYRTLVSSKLFNIHPVDTNPSVVVKQRNKTEKYNFYVGGRIKIFI